MSSIQIYDKINTCQYFLFTPFLGDTDHSVLRKYTQLYLTSITRILGTFVLPIQHCVVKECTWQSIQIPALCIGRSFILHYVKLSSGPDHQNEQFFRAVKEHRAPQLIFFLCSFRGASSQCVQIFLIDLTTRVSSDIVSMLGFSFKKLNYGKQILYIIVFKKGDTKENRIKKALIKSVRAVLPKRRTSFTQFSGAFTLGH